MSKLSEALKRVRLQEANAQELASEVLNWIPKKEKEAAEKTIGAALDKIDLRKELEDIMTNAPVEIPQGSTTTVMALVRKALIKQVVNKDD